MAHLSYTSRFFLFSYSSSEISSSCINVFKLEFVYSNGEDECSVTTVTAIKSILPGFRLAISQAVTRDKRMILKAKVTEENTAYKNFAAQNHKSHNQSKVDNKFKLAVNMNRRKRHKVHS